MQMTREKETTRERTYLKVSSQSSSLELGSDTLDLGVEVTEESDELRLGLGTDLLLTAVLEDVGEDGEEVVDVLKEDGKDLGIRRRSLEELEDASEDDSVLDEIVLGEGEEEKEEVSERKARNEEETRRELNSP